MSGTNFFELAALADSDTAGAKYRINCANVKTMRIEEAGQFFTAYITYTDGTRDIIRNLTSVDPDILQCGAETND